MNKFYKNISAIMLAVAMFTVNVPSEMVSALGSMTMGSGNMIKSTTVGNQKVDPSDLSFDVWADDTFESKTVFAGEEFVLTVSNSNTGTQTISYEWFRDDGSTPDNLVPSDESKKAGITENTPGTYTYYVEGSYQWIEDQEKDNTPVDATVKSPDFTVTVMERPVIVNGSMKTSTSRYPDTTTAYDYIYFETYPTYGFDKVSVEWDESDFPTAGFNDDESSSNHFRYKPHADTSNSVGYYTLNADVFYDHDDDSSTSPAFIETVNGDDIIEVYSTGAVSVNLTTDSGTTDYLLTATGSETLIATVTGLGSSDYVTAYLWTDEDDETLQSTSTSDETDTYGIISIANLGDSTTFTVTVGYVDDTGAASTVTDSITLTKDSGSSGDSDSDSGGDGSTDDDSSGGGSTGGSAYYPYINTDLTVASKTYVQYREAQPLTISVDARLDGTVSYKWYVNTLASTVGATLLTYEYGIPTNSSTIEPSVTPSTQNVGTLYYYCEVTNHYGDDIATTRSNIATIIVIADDTAATKYTVDSTGSLTVADYSKVVIDWSTFDEFIDNGGEALYVTGAYIQNLRVPAIYSSYGYEVFVTDTGYDLEYSWKIKDGSKVSGYLDLALNTTTSLSGVEKGNSPLNYDARYSEIIEFKHEGALTTNDKGITLTMPTTVKDGDGHLNKINADQTIDYSNYVKGSIEDGILTVNMKDCSNWVVSALKLAELSNYDNSNGTGAVTGFLNIPTFVGFEISEFKNVVVGQMIYLDKINMDTIENNRFSGWYYDTAFLEPVSTNDVKNGMLVSREIATNGLYPKYEQSYGYTPTVATSVPSTYANTIKLESLF